MFLRGDAFLIYVAIYVAFLVDTRVNANILMWEKYDETYVSAVKNIEFSKNNIGFSQNLLLGISCSQKVYPPQPV